MTIAWDGTSQPDAITIDLYRSGSFALDLQPGENVLSVYAVNEGSVVPNTALLEISDVVSGASSQEWRRGPTVTAPRRSRR